MKARIVSLLLLILSLTAVSCTKYNYVSVPDPVTHHDTTMWEYMSGDAYNWSLTRQMIDRAGMRDIFEGKSQYGSDLTFFGITNHSIRRYLYENGLESVSDLDPALCREWLLSSLYPKARKLQEWKEGTRVAGQLIGTGGEMCTMLSGKQLWIYSYRAPYNGVVGMGPRQLHLVSPDRQTTTDVASHDISTRTGIVHSLSYNFTPNDF